VLFVTSGRDVQRELADSCEFNEERFGIQQPGVRELIGSEACWLHLQRCFRLRGRGATYIRIIGYRVVHEGHYRFYMTYIV
jgi:hypothetical protein